MYSIAVAERLLLRVRGDCIDDVSQHMCYAVQPLVCDDAADTLNEWNCACTNGVK